MKVKSRLATGCAVLIASASLAACSGDSPYTQPEASAKDNPTPMPLSIVLAQVGDIPGKGNEIEQLIEQYTNTRLDFHWIPTQLIPTKLMSL
ncbi:MAG: transporter substrate-binding protein [Paenibacillus sp.]|nr:transporter substrate-binding protein [Paenibacillus sp.]